MSKDVSTNGRPKVFLCYAGEDHSLMADFVERFKSHNDLEPLYDKTPHSGNMHERFRGFASECDVAILLVNARFTNLASYASKYEMPILLERQERGEVVIIGVRFSDVVLDEWNEKGDIYFFQIRNDDLANTRRKDDNGDIFNRQFAVYEVIDKRDRNTFHAELKRWMDKLVNKRSKGIEKSGGSSVPFLKPKSNAGEIENNIPVKTEKISKSPVILQKPIENLKSDSAHLCIEKKLKAMAGIYFDNNDFQRPEESSTNYFFTYLNLQGVKLSIIGRELRKTRTDKIDFVESVQVHLNNIEHCCNEIQSLFIECDYHDRSLAKGLRHAIKVKEKISDALFGLINKPNEANRSSFKLEHLLPLADQAQELGNLLTQKGNKPSTLSFN